jgi:hypothetical protein
MMNMEILRTLCGCSTHNGFIDNDTDDRNEDEAVNKRSENFCPVQPKRPVMTRWLACYCDCREAEADCKTVREHVACITDEGNAVGQNTANEFNDHDNERNDQ